MLPAHRAFDVVLCNICIACKCNSMYEVMKQNNSFGVWWCPYMGKSFFLCFSRTYYTFFLFLSFRCFIELSFWEMYIAPSWHFTLSHIVLVIFLSLKDLSHLTLIRVRFTHISCLCALLNISNIFFRCTLCLLFLINWFSINLFF